MEEVSDFFYHFKPDEKILKATFLPTGLSNINYHIITEQQHYLLKCYRNALPIAQLLAQKQLAKKDIAPQVYGFNKINNTALFDYAPGEVADNISITTIVESLIHLHQFRTDSVCLDLAAHFSPYKQLNEYKTFEHKINLALSLVSQLPKTLGFCHNDLIKNNIINEGNRFVIIDFEYAQTNDVFFDLAAIASSYQFYEQQQSQLVNLYCQQGNLTINRELAKNKLDIFCFIYNALCYFWYIKRGFDEAAILALSQLNQSEFKSK